MMSNADRDPRQIPQLLRRRQCLLEALALAAQYRGACAPNPAVGAMVWLPKGEDMVVLGKGAHLGPGHPHAEVVALREAGQAARGARISVTLEPCGHWGRTPPCVQAIIDAGITAVDYAYADPNPLVRDEAGLLRLEAAGVRCTHLPQQATDHFYQSYAFWHHTGMPWVTSKLAVSADGQVAGTGGQPVWLTGPEAQAHTHAHRYFSDVLLTSVATILSDDPRMNVRAEVFMSAYDKTSALAMAKPLAILDADARCPITARCLQTASVVLYHRADAPKSRVAALQDAGVRCVAVPATPQASGCLDLAAVLRHLGQSAHDVWVEAGPTLLAALLNARWVQTHWQYTALDCTLGPDATAGLTDAHLSQSLRHMQTGQLGKDRCDLWGLGADHPSLPPLPTGLLFEAQIGYHWGTFRGAAIRSWMMAHPPV